MQQPEQQPPSRTLAGQEVIDVLVGFSIQSTRKSATAGMIEQAAVRRLRLSGSQGFLPHVRDYGEHPLCPGSAQGRSPHFTTGNSTKLAWPGAWYTRWTDFR